MQHGTTIFKPKESTSPEQIIAREETSSAPIAASSSGQAKPETFIESIEHELGSTLHGPMLMALPAESITFEQYLQLKGRAERLIAIIRQKDVADDTITADLERYRQMRDYLLSGTPYVMHALFNFSSVPGPEGTASDSGRWAVTRAFTGTVAASLQAHSPTL